MITTSWAAGSVGWPGAVLGAPESYSGHVGKHPVMISSGFAT
jgi:hypothetical protein